MRSLKGTRSRLRVVSLLPGRQKRQARRAKKLQGTPVTCKLRRLKVAKQLTMARSLNRRLLRWTKAPRQRRKMKAPSRSWQQANEIFIHRRAQPLADLPPGCVFHYHGWKNRSIQCTDSSGQRMANR